MLKGLTITFETLDRFDGRVQVDLSGSLSVVVGPNGSGKSTLLEAIAEVLTFLQLYMIEGLESEVRKRIGTQRPTRPSWTRAVVGVEFGEGHAPSVQASLAPYLEGPDCANARVGLTRRDGDSERWTLSSVGVGDREVAFDTSGPIVVDSRRKVEAQTEVQRLADVLSQSQANTNTELANCQKELNAARAVALHNQSPEHLSIMNTLEARINELNADQQRRAKEIRQRTVELQHEIAVSSQSAMKMLDGDGKAEIAKADVEAFCISLGLPTVVYLQGSADFAGLIASMTAKLGRLKDQRRSEATNSEFNRMRLRLEALLKMHVTVDSTSEHALMVDDRPVNEVSAGTWCALGFAAVCEQEDSNALVIWDEPETGLHPTWARKVCDLMIQNPRRFLIATHRTEFVPVTPLTVRVYKSIARPPEPGDKALCRLEEATTTLATGLAIAIALGLEPSRVLFTTNGVLWVEGPSDVIYWRFWLTNAARARGVALVEGFDYSFMFSAGSLLANETIADSSHQLAPGAVNLLRLIGASRVIVDTDFNPGDVKERVTREELTALLQSTSWHETGFVGPRSLPHLKPRVREMVQAIEQIRLSGNLSSIVSTWGREAENGLTDDAFRRTVNRVYGVMPPKVLNHIATLTVGDWEPYEKTIRQHLELGLVQPELAEFRVEGKDGPRIAQMTVIEDKVAFARKYVEAHATIGSNLRPEAERIVAATLDWILSVRAAYLQ